MPLLDAALAFSLTMLVIATLVSTLVQLTHTMLGIRQSEFRKMLDEFTQTEIQPTIDRELARLSSQFTAETIAEIKQNLNADAAEVATRLIQEHAEQMHLSSANLVELLKRTDMGNKLLTQLGNHSQAVFDELAQRYEAVGQKFTDSFRQYSRRIAAAITLVLALALNLDSINIARQYMSNQAQRQAALATYNKVVAYHLSASGSESQLQVNQTLDQLKQSIAEANAQVNALNTAGFPIGWTYFPGYTEAVAAPADRTVDMWLQWIFGILLTTILVGLGTPFWFDVVRGLVQFTRQSASSDKN